MKEIIFLSRKSETYLKSASLLFESEDYDSAISRIYYSMFFLTEAILLTKDLHFSSHKGVISGFSEHFIKTEIFPKDFSKILRTTFEKRQASEYGFEFKASKDEVIEVLNQGKVFYETLIDYFQKNNYL